MDFLLAGAFGGAISLICLIGGFRAGRGARPAAVPAPAGRVTLTIAASNVAAERAMTELDEIVRRSRRDVAARARG